MTNIEQKALELVNEVCTGERGMAPYPCVDRCNDSRWEALCRSIEQHERFRQNLSDAVTEIISIIENGEAGVAAQELERFIIAKPDPLAEALTECGINPLKSGADKLRAALAKRGGRIVFDD